MSAATLVMAGGGTGGHVFPLVAVADALRALRPELRLVFVGTAKGIESSVVPARGYELELLSVLPIRGGGVKGAVRGAARAAGAAGEARALLRRLRPAAVFSIGGYAAGPVTLAARSLRLPVGLMEPNSVIGLANRWIAPLVQRAYTAFADVERHFRSRVVLRTGVPIRDGFEPRPYEGPKSPLSVLVLGGSQGAKALNEAVPRALSDIRRPIDVVHQCGRAQEAEVVAAYAELAARTRVRVVPFIDDMPSALAAADLVIGRSGASALAEICAVGRPSILVPYPHAAGDHQRRNAESLARAGAAVCVPSARAFPERIAAELCQLTRDASTLPTMARAARALGRPHAARTIARDLLALAGLGDPVPVAGGSPPGDRDLGFRFQSGVEDAV